MSTYMRSRILAVIQIFASRDLDATEVARDVFLIRDQTAPVFFECFAYFYWPWMTSIGLSSIPK